MLAATAVVLIGADLAVWAGGHYGVLRAADDMLIWIACMALGLISILWSVALLGIQPLIMAFSYVVGGVVSYFGVRNIGGIAEAEIMTAGATYGSFGMLLVSSITAAVRSTWYRRDQVPFVFMMLVLLLVDGALTGGVFGAGGRVLLRGVVYPFVLAGIMMGVVWSIIVRFRTRPGRKKRKAFAEEMQKAAETAMDDTVAVQPEVLISEPETVALEEEDQVEPAVAALEPEEPLLVPVPEDLELPDASELPETAFKRTETPDDEMFFPLEIDQSESFFAPLEASGSESENRDEPKHAADFICDVPDEMTGKDSEEWMSSHPQLFRALDDSDGADEDDQIR